MAKEKDYNPVPVNNRKLMRSIIKAQVEKQYGYHNVSAKVHEYYEKYKNVKEKLNNGITD